MHISKYREFWLAKQEVDKALKEYLPNIEYKVLDFNEKSVRILTQAGDEVDVSIFNFLDRGCNCG